MQTIEAMTPIISRTPTRTPSIACPTGTVRRGTVCVRYNTPVSSITCPPGTKKVGSSCVPFTYKCPVGTAEVDEDIFHVNKGKLERPIYKGSCIGPVFGDANNMRSHNSGSCDSPNAHLVHIFPNVYGGAGSYCVQPKQYS